MTAEPIDPEWAAHVLSCELDVMVFFDYLLTLDDDERRAVVMSLPGEERAAVAAFAERESARIDAHLGPVHDRMAALEDEIVDTFRKGLEGGA